MAMFTLIFTMWQWGFGQWGMGKMVGSGRQVKPCHVWVKVRVKRSVARHAACRHAKCLRKRRPDAPVSMSPLSFCSFCSCSVP